MCRQWRWRQRLAPCQHAGFQAPSFRPSWRRRTKETAAASSFRCGPFGYTHESALDNLCTMYVHYSLKLRASPFSVCSRSQPSNMERRESFHRQTLQDKWSVHPWWILVCSPSLSLSLRQGGHQPERGNCVARRPFCDCALAHDGPTSQWVQKNENFKYLDTVVGLLRHVLVILTTADETW